MSGQGRTTEDMAEGKEDHPWRRKLRGNGRRDPGKGQDRGDSDPGKAAEQGEEKTLHGGGTRAPQWSKMPCHLALLPYPS